MSSGLDEGTLRTVQSGRETAGSMLRTAQKHLQKVFVVWLVGFLGTIMVISGAWGFIKQELVYEAMPQRIIDQTNIIAVTPFDVILLQVKIGVIVGLAFAAPVLLYYGRDSLRDRDMWIGDKVAAWKIGVIAVIALLLFAGGVVYAVELFFPLMFAFLAENALNAGFQPEYSIVKWFQFVILLGTSFGLAAQMPLLISGLSYTGIVPYETFRDKWRYAVVIIFGFGALFSPPDPFTQVMWALPLVGLYGVSLGISKLLVMTKRAGQEVEASAVARDHWNVLAGTALAAGVAVYYVIVSEAFTYIQAGVGYVSSRYDPADVVRPQFFGATVEASAAAIGVLVALVACLAVLYYFMIQRLSEVSRKNDTEAGDPADVDIEELSAAGVRAAPPETFADMDESEAVRLADDAISGDDTEKAEAILDRFDEVDQETDDEDESEEGEGNVVTSTAAGVADAFTEEETTEDDVGGLLYEFSFLIDSLTSKAIWFVATFLIVSSAVFVFLYAGIPVGAEPVATGATVTSDTGVTVAEKVTVVANNVTLVTPNGTVIETGATVTARDGSVDSRPLTAVVTNETTVVRNGAVHVTENGTRRTLVENGTVLVQEHSTAVKPSGIGLIRNVFVQNLPPQMQNDVRFVNLHPVEHLIFIVKFSALAGAVAILPLLFYFTWPPLREHGYVVGDRTTIGVWGGSLVLTLVGGSLLGFLFVAPTVISWLAEDALDSGMIISYQVSNFFWLVVGLTVGIGALTEIPITMVLFHRGGIISFQWLQKHWRMVTLGVFVFSAVVSPKGILTMFVIAIPVTLAFLVGLLLMWIYTLGGRRESGGGGGILAE